MRTLLCAIVVAGCTTNAVDDAPGTTDTDAGAQGTDTSVSAPILADDLPNPLLPEVALYPWPSDQYLVPGDTRTGLRISVPTKGLPEGLAPEMFVRDDGFSRVVPIVTWLPGGIDPTTLPDPTDWSATTRADSPVLLIRDEAWTRWPAMVELDATASDPAEASLIVRPHRPLDPGARYVVVVRDSVKALDGSAFVRSAATEALLSGAPSDDRAIEAWRAPFETVRAALDAVGVSPDEVVQAWTFTTRSREGIVDPAVAMQDAGMAAPSDAYTLQAPTQVDRGGDKLSCAPDCVAVYGTFEVPDFLDADGQIRWGADGLPEAVGTRTYPLMITVPNSLSGTRPVVMFGHGFFSAIEEPTWSSLFKGLKQWDMAAVTTKFLGFAEEDLLESAAVLGNDLSNLGSIPAKQLQSHVAFTVLYRVLTEHVADTLTVDVDAGTITPLDGDAIHYMGISNGGTQGAVMMATSPVLSRGGLVVAGGGWAHMLQRASQWRELGAVYAGRYTDSRELQLSMSLLQQVFDPVDSLNYAQHLIDDRLPGRPADPELLLVEVVGDAQVANLVTRWVAGAAGFPLITPSVASVWNVPEVSAAPPDGAPGGVGYEIYDLGKPPLPTGNVAPAENGAHDEVRKRDDYNEQMGTFLESGRVVRTCDGPCAPL